MSRQFHFLMVDTLDDKVSVSIPLSPDQIRDMVAGLDLLQSKRRREAAKASHPGIQVILREQVNAIGATIAGLSNLPIEF